MVAYVRLVDGSIEMGRTLRLMSTGLQVEPLEVGVFSPTMRPTGRLDAGEVGYVATGLKTVSDCRVGDTLTWHAAPAELPLPGYTPMKSMVFASVYPSDAADYLALRDALSKLQLNDASLNYQTETSTALGYGFRCGFLGLFHMEIVQERLEREYDLDLVFTAPSVEYEVTLTDGSQIIVDNPAEMPDPTTIAEISRAVGEDRRVHPHRIHRPGDGPGHQSPRRVQVPGIPGSAPRAAQLSHPADRDPDRFL